MNHCKCQSRNRIFLSVQCTIRVTIKQIWIPQKQNIIKRDCDCHHLSFLLTSLWIMSVQPPSYDKSQEAAGQSCFAFFSWYNRLFQEEHILPCLTKEWILDIRVARAWATWVTRSQSRAMARREAGKWWSFSNKCWGQTPWQQHAPTVRPMWVTRIM